MNAIDILYKHSKTNTLNDFSEWLKQKSNFRFSEANLSRWLREKHEPLPVYKQIFQEILKNEL
jgi:hypothetical protein